MTNTIPNPLDTQRNELAIARMQRDFLQDQLNEIATALYVRATIQCENGVVDGVNALLDDWEEMYREKAEDFANDLREQLQAHKLPLPSADELRSRFGESDPHGQ